MGFISRPSNKQRKGLTPGSEIEPIGTHRSDHLLLLLILKSSFCGPKSKPAPVFPISSAGKKREKTFQHFTSIMPRGIMVFCDRFLRFFSAHYEALFHPRSSLDASQLFAPSSSHHLFTRWAYQTTRRTKSQPNLTPKKAVRVNGSDPTRSAAFFAFQRVRF